MLFFDPLSSFCPTKKTCHKKSDRSLNPLPQEQHGHRYVPHLATTIVEAVSKGISGEAIIPAKKCEYNHDNNNDPDPLCAVAKKSAAASISTSITTISHKILPSAEVKHRHKSFNKRNGGNRRFLHPYVSQHTVATRQETSRLSRYLIYLHHMPKTSERFFSGRTLFLFSQILQKKDAPSLILKEAPLKWLSF